MPTVHIGSQRIFYEEQGQGTPLLLIPGIGHTHFCWWKQMGPLSQKGRVISMDNRDAGESGPGKWAYSIAQMADDAAGLLKNLQSGRATVIGWSMGGFIAMELALRHPELVSKLVLVSTTAGRRIAVQAAPVVLPVLLKGDHRNFSATVRQFLLTLTAPGYMETHLEDLRKMEHHSMIRPMKLTAYQRQLGAILRWKGVRERLGEIAIPTLVIHGEVDPLIPYSNGLHLAAHIPNARLFSFPGTGHLVQIEAAERFNEAVTHFLR